MGSVHDPAMLRFAALLAVLVALGSCASSAPVVTAQAPGMVTVCAGDDWQKAVDLAQAMCHRQGKDAVLVSRAACVHSPLQIAPNTLADFRCQ
jgi:opacity protein-like surface antigen